MSKEHQSNRAIEFGIVPGGFAVAVAVWLTAFVSRLPMVMASPRVVFGLLLVVMLVGALLVGWGAGRREVGGGGSARRVMKRAISTMLVAGFVNVLLVGSVVGAASVEAGSGDGPSAAVNVITMNGLIWIPGSLIASALFGVVGGAFGCWGRRAEGSREGMSKQLASFARGEQAALALVTVVTTFGLILVGGVVTSAEAGLAVPDWPNSYGWNMFLFPFSRMVGGIYYEHAHRLIGSLVGLETLVLFVWLWWRRPQIGKRGLVWLGTLAFVLVCVQGVLGGARVFVVNQFGHDVALKLAVVHGFHAQVFLLTLAALGWLLARRGVGDGDEATAGVRCGVMLRVLGRVFVVVILAQTLAGAVYRHLGGTEGAVGWAFPVHLMGAGMVFLLGMLQMGGVMMGLSGNSPAVMRVMRAVFTTFVIIAVQVALGLGAWWVTSRYDAFDQRTSDWMIYLTAGHVVCGAILLVSGLWSMLEILHFREESMVSS